MRDYAGSSNLTEDLDSANTPSTMTPSTITPSTMTQTASQDSLGDNSRTVHHGGDRLGDHMGCGGEQCTVGQDRRSDRADAMLDSGDDAGSTTRSGGGDSQDSSEDSLG